MRLIQAEVLKLVRRRGLMAWSVLLTVGAVVIAEVVLVVLHAVNPAHHGPPGGASNMEHLVLLLGGLGNVAAILIGATAGTQDVANGVFRDLVVTGRPRATLFNVRVPGALLVFLPMMAAGFALVTGVSFLAAGGLPHPTADDVGHYVLYVASLAVLDVVLAAGLAAFASARVVVGVLIAWNAIVAQLLMAIGSLGGARKGIDVAAIEHFAPEHAIHHQVPMSAVTAVLVLLVWAAVFLRGGRWWTARRDA
ncbi:MAG: hypothetical protein V7644_456 [Actinomycetota bacterium]